MRPERLLLLGTASALAACNSSDRLGELQTKPVFALMSGAYYGGMCEGATGTGEQTADIRAMKIHTSAGDCRVLYLDGVDRSGELLIYAERPGERLACDGLLQRLKARDASAAVIAKAGERCS
ncbi:hypothetical protein [Stenotrophomonas sp. ZAC14A_NAIMI4_1]|uniref:hypothetical protein n=1 Tax=Stenotrophomonas sp. ZAC14A_NAIMI4_1 TaxID=2072412 RepID=UPI00131EDE17|nr:hypothetical protein [Stenotrophomonas sp. ZAC14A_NAIMI4_1]